MFELCILLKAARHFLTTEDMWNSVIYFTFISTVSLVVPASGMFH